MLYLASPVRPVVYPLAQQGRIGILFQPAYRPKSYHDLSEVTWAADNGCYTAGDAFDLERYLAFLDALAEFTPTCRFATAPDVVGDAEATWERSRPVLPLIRALGYPAACVAQDGFDADAVEWDAFDVLFVGGTTNWKLTVGYDLAGVARDRGKASHMGRVNSGKRFAAARSAGFDTADGTFLAFAPEHNVKRMLGWFERAQRAPSLFEVSDPC